MTCCVALRLSGACAHLPVSFYHDSLTRLAPVRFLIRLKIASPIPKFGIGPRGTDAFLLKGKA